MLSLSTKLISLFTICGALLAAPIDDSLNDLFNNIPAVKGCKYKVNSGYRTKAKNKQVGGAKNSYHLHDRARDIATNCRRDVINLGQLFGLTVIIYRTHLHIDNREKPLCLVKTKRGYRYCKAKDYQ